VSRPRFGERRQALLLESRQPARRHAFREEHRGRLRTVRAFDPPRRQFWELVDRLRARPQGMSVIVATAYMEEAERL
jgi:hypothetical protein